MLVSNTCKIHVRLVHVDQILTKTKQPLFWEICKCFVRLVASVLSQDLRVTCNQSEVIFASVFMLVHVGTGTLADDYAGIYIKIFQYSPVKVLVKFIARVREFQF